MESTRRLEVGRYGLEIFNPGLTSRGFEVFLGSKEVIFGIDSLHYLDAWKTLRICVRGPGQRILDRMKVGTAPRTGETKLEELAFSRDLN